MRKTLVALLSPVLPIVALTTLSVSCGSQQHNPKFLPEPVVHMGGNNPFGPDKGSIDDLTHVVRLVCGGSDPTNVNDNSNYVIIAGSEHLGVNVAGQDEEAGYDLLEQNQLDEGLGVLGSELNFTVDDSMLDERVFTFSCPTGFPQFEDSSIGSFKYAATFLIENVNASPTFSEEIYDYGGRVENRMDLQINSIGIKDEDAFTCEDSEDPFYFNITGTKAVTQSKRSVGIENFANDPRSYVAISDTTDTVFPFQDLLGTSTDTDTSVESISIDNYYTKEFNCKMFKTLTNTTLTAIRFLDRHVPYFANFCGQNWEYITNLKIYIVDGADQNEGINAINATRGTSLPISESSFAYIH